MATAKRKTTKRKASQARSRSSPATARTSRRAASKRPAGDTREQVRSLTLKVLRDHDMKLRDVPRLAQHLIEGAASGLNNAVPTSSRSVLRQVVDGLTDAAETTVQSTRTIVASTTSRGAKFVKQDAAGP